MKKYSFVFLIIVLLTASVSSSAYAQLMLKIASPEFPPYVYTLESGEIGGVAAEIVSEVFRSMGVGYENTIYPWARALYMLKGGTIHALYTIMKNRERETIFHYPDEHILMPIGYFLSGGPMWAD
jgi:polar amino acid transport system substrate-binding protein